MTIHPHIAVDASAPAEPPADLTDFAPVPVSERHDGWTPDRQRAFIEVLADTGSVVEAAKAVGMGVEGAYRLRRRADAAGFAEAWDAAYGMITRRLTDAAFARAIHGVVNPVYHGGEIVGERVQYDERLTRFLLERHDPEGYGRLMGCDPRWIEERDPLRARVRKLPHLLARLFGRAHDPAPEEAERLGLTPLPRKRRR